MVRKIGSNTPSIDAPELYDISSKMYAQMGQDVQQAASASMQALSGLNRAYDANARRQMALLAEQEELKAAQAKASQAKGQGGGLVQGLTSVVTGIMGGLAAQDALRQKREAFEYQRMMDERKMSLDEQKFAYERFNDQQRLELDQMKFMSAEEREQRKVQLEQQESFVDEVVGGLSADLEEKMIGMTYEQGVAYTQHQIQGMREQYATVFEQYPQIERMFNAKVNEVRSDINRHYGKTMRDEIQTQDSNYVEQMNSKLQLTFATRMNEIGASAGVWTAEEANQALNNVINQAVAEAAKDETFVRTVQRNPALLGSFYKTLYDNAYVMFDKYSKENAEIQATVQKIGEVNQIMGANIGNMDDPAVVGMLQEVFASKGLPWQNPREWGTSVVSTMKNQAETMELQQQISVAVQAKDPMFGLNTGEQRIVAEAAVTRNIWDAENNKNGWNFMNLRGYYETELAAAKESGDRNAEKVWRSNIQYLDTYEERQKQFKESNKALQQAQLDYAKAVRPPDPNAVVNDPISGAPIRMTIGGNEPMQKYTPEEIQVFKDRLEDAHAERKKVVDSTAVEFGVNLENPADESFIDEIQQGAAPYVQQLQQRNLQNGRTTNTMGTIKNMQPPSAPKDDRQGAKPVNFSGGRVPNEQVVRGQTGTLPFATTQVPLANAVPFQGGVATAPNIGFVPFKGGTVKIVSKPDSKGLVLGSSDPRVATMTGGEVIYAGGTQTMGNVVVVKTNDGLAEVFGGLQNINVQPGQFVKPGVAVGSTQTDLEFQVWKTDDPLASLRMEIPRNETNPVAYLQGISGYRKAPDGLGTIDLLNNKPQPVGMGNSNVFAGDGYAIFGTVLVDKRTGKQRQLTPKEFKDLYPDGMKQALTYAEQRQREANASYNQPAANGVPPVRRNDKGQMIFKSDDFAHVPKESFVFPITGHDGITGDQGDQHRGVDIFAPIGARILNPLSGTIVYAIDDKAMTKKYGTSVPGKNVPQYSIKIKLDNPIQFKGKTIRYVFMTHLSSLSSAAKKGARVESGVDLGGNGHANAAHLHLGFGETEKMSGNHPLSNADTLELLNQIRLGGGSVNANTNRVSHSQQSNVTSQISGRGYGARAKPVKDADPHKRRDSFDLIEHPLLTGNAAGLANLRAFGDLIAWAEGHGRPTQYNTYVGWGTVDTARPHRGADPGTSGASGRYQALSKTWSEVFGSNVAMTPQNQDLFFVTKLIHRGALEDVLSGNFEKAFTKVQNEWVSITNNSPQGRHQGKYSPQFLAQKAEVAARSYRSGDANLYDGDGRTPVTNAPLHQVNAAQSQSAYGKPSPNANFGYPGLVKNTYLRKSIYNVAVKTGLPQQMIADAVARQTANFTEVSGINEATIRQFVSTTTPLPAPPGQQQRPVPSRAPELPRPTRQIPEPPNHTRRTPVARPTPQQLIPDRRTPVGRSYTSGNARKKKEWHFHKRSNCPTCQSMPVFLPHFIYK